jgi:hypothetical protein
MQIRFVRIGFAFKSNGSIGLVSVSKSQQVVKIFQNIPYKKPKKQHFQLLPEMYFFMVNYNLSQFISRISGDNERPDRHGSKPFAAKGEQTEQYGTVNEYGTKIVYPPQLILQFQTESKTQSALQVVNTLVIKVWRMAVL